MSPSEIEGGEAERQRDVYLLIRRKKARILTNATETMKISELKELVQRLWSENPKDMFLFNEEGLRMKDNDTLLDHRITSKEAKYISPYVIDVCFSKDYEHAFRNSLHL